MKLRNSLIFMGLFVPALSFADASDFNYVEIQYLDGKIGSSVDGVGVAGNLALTNQLFATARLADVSGNGNKYKGRQLGLGYIIGENNTGTVYAGVNYARKSVTGNSDNGYGLELGARMNVNEETELNVAVNHLDFGSGDDSTVVTAGLVYRFTQNLSGVVNYSRDSSDRMLGLGLRLSF